MQLPLSYCHHQRKDVISQTMYYDSATAATRKTYQITFSLGARYYFIIRQDSRKSWWKDQDKSACVLNNMDDVYLYKVTEPH